MPAEHKILGVGDNATTAEIVAAYRRAAMRWHPDRNAGNSAAKDHFQKIQSAYKTLRAVANADEDPDWDAMLGDEDVTRANWRKDIPPLTLFFLTVGIIAVVALPPLLAIAGWSLALLFAMRLYREPSSEAGATAERWFKRIARAYFFLLLAGVVGWLATALW